MRGISPMTALIKGIALCTKAPDPRYLFGKKKTRYSLLGRVRASAYGIVP